MHPDVPGKAGPLLFLIIDYFLGQTEEFTSIDELIKVKNKINQKKKVNQNC